MIFNLDKNVRVRIFGHVPQKRGAWHEIWIQDNNLLLYCTEGEINMLVDDIVYHLDTDDILLIPEGAHYKPLDGGSCCYYFIAFDAETLPDDAKTPIYISTIPHAWLSEGYAYTCIDDYISAVKVDRLIKKAPYRMKHLFETAIKLTPHLRYSDQLYLDNLLRELLICMGSEQTQKSNRKLAEIVKYIHSHYSEPLGLSDIAKYFSLSPSHVVHLFKKEFGCKPSEYVNRIRISAAQTLLAETDLTVSEIADTIGYSDVYYFSKIFKKTVGVPPTKFRNQEAF